MKRLVIIALLILSLLLSSCGQTPSLWGVHATPTAPGKASYSSVINIQVTPSDPPSPTSIPPTRTPTEAVTSTYTPTPTFISAFVTPNTTPRYEFTWTPTPSEPTILYYAQSGDWLPAVANRFGISVSDITSPKTLPEKGFIDTGTLLIIPDRLDPSQQLSPAAVLIPDSEVVFSATAIDFNIDGYIRDAGGYLSTYREYLGSTGWTTGTQGIERLAYENSINPRLLLAILDFESKWVRGKPADDFRMAYPLGYENIKYKGMFQQLAWAVNQLSAGYYGWRAGTLTHITFRDRTKIRLDPRLNAGTVALMYFFSRLHSLNEWLRIIDQNGGFPVFYAAMFGDSWVRAEKVDHLFPPALSQPPMVLPFETNTEWSYTGGPHGAWEHDGALAAIDFAPATDHGGCDPTPTWILSAAPGLVVRSDGGVVIVDMDGDGHEQTGWNLLYLHVASEDRVRVGTWVETDDVIGHASCEGGVATGTHLHFARKYNGEWITADGPIPFVLSGWKVQAGNIPYEGKLIKGNKTITADPVGQAKSVIFREEDQ